MPRSAKSAGGKVLDYFRHAEAGEVKAIYGLVGDIVRERFAAPKPAATKQRKQRKTVTAPVATESKQEAAD